ncbi:MAG: glucosamine-6-phosphate isomerase, partial [Armatimonadetes bacterium]|nr:glucosamine-6-phosphate isomerase [Armatimonadota bacterium]
MRSPDSLPEYLSVPLGELGKGTPVRVHLKGDMASIARDFADAMLQEIREANRHNRRVTMIVPVGPVDQYPLLAESLNRQKVSCREVMLINMDEYLTGEDQWVDLEHPLSFRGYMNRQFYDLLDPELAPGQENRVFPDPRDPDRIGRLIEERGGVEACFGGIGINGHIAFNEPPEEGMDWSNEEFAALPTRALDLTRETRTINSNTVGGEISIIPKRAITVGMREILGARRLRLYCNRPWQSAVVRRVLHGPITPACPASFLRTHADA